MPINTRRLNFALTRNVVLVGLVISLLIGAVRIHLQLNRRLEQINIATASLIEAVAGTAAQAAFAIDESLAQEAVAGIMHSPFVHSVEIVDDFGTILAKDAKNTSNKVSTWTALHSGSWRSSFHIPLTTRGMPVGFLRINMDEHAAAREISALATYEATGYLAFFGILAGALLLVFYKTLTRPLVRMEGFLSQINPDKPGLAHLPIPRGHEQDEIGSLATAFNALLHRVEQDMLNINLAKQKLEERESHFRSLFENTGTATFVCGEDTLIKACNLRFADLSGYSREEIEGRIKWTTFVDTIDMPRIAQYHQSRLDKDSSAPLEYDFNFINKAGEKKSGLIQVGLLPGSTDRIASVLDITEIKKAREELLVAKEQAEAASKAKSEFLANMSHEIRTPLNGVLGMLQILQTTNPTEDQQKYIQIAIKSTRRLTNLLSDILDISRIEAGKMQIMEETFVVENLKEAVLDIFMTAADNKSLNLEFIVDPAMPEKLVGDESRIRQILLNLVGNAIKFTSQGYVRVQISPLRVENGDKFHALFAVSDTGQGIPKDQLGSILEPFVQAKPPGGLLVSGAGLGLSIVRRLLDLMHGELRVESSLGQGTTMHVTLPFNLPRPGETAREDAEQAVAAPKLVKSRFRRILVVDDDEISLFSAQKILENNGYQVATASNGQQVLDILASENFDLVLMDVQMPVMDGVETTRAIRNGAAGNDKSDMPIVAMTAYAMSGDREQFLEAGMDDYLSKPVEIPDLLAVLQRLPDRKR